MRLSMSLMLLVLVGGCSDYSKNAIYGVIEHDTIFDPQLLGKWEYVDDLETKTKSGKPQPPGFAFVDRVDDTNQYRLSMSGSKPGEDDVFFGYLVQIGDERIID